MASLNEFLEQNVYYKFSFIPSNTYV